MRLLILEVHLTCRSLYIHGCWDGGFQVAVEVVPWDSEGFIETILISLGFFSLFFAINHNTIP